MDQGPTEQQRASSAVSLGYPGMQLARALTLAEQCTDPLERARAEEKVDQWSAALFGILGGGIRPGSRTPVSGLPAWGHAAGRHGRLRHGRRAVRRAPAAA